MISLLPLPGELSLGYATRLMAVNLFAKPENFFRDLKKKFSSPKAYQALAAAAGIPVKEFFNWHTLISLSGCRPDVQTEIPPELRDDPVPYDLSLGLKGGKTFKNLIKNSRHYSWGFCQQCKVDDIKTYGCAYWHCDHQIPGVNVCIRHETPLMICAGEAVMSYPTIGDVPYMIPSDTLLQIANTPPLRMYRYVLERIMKSPDRNFWPPIWKLVRAYANKNYVRVAPVEKFSLLTHQRKISDDWLDGHLPFLSLQTVKLKFMKIEILNKHIPVNDFFQIQLCRAWPLGMGLLFLCYRPEYEAQLKEILL